MGFIIGHFLLLWCVAGFIMPHWLDIFIIEERRDDWKQPTAPCVLRDTTEGEIANNLETGSISDSSTNKRQDPVTKTSRRDEAGVIGEVTQHDSNSSLTVDGAGEKVGKQI